MRQIETVKQKFSRFVEAHAPFQLKKMAIDGVLPATFVELNIIRLILLHDPDEKVKNLALSALRNVKVEDWVKFIDSFNDDVLVEFIKMCVFPSDVVDEIVSRGKLDSSGLKEVIINYGQDRRIIESLSKRQAELISDKELAELILRAPETPTHIKDYIKELTGIEIESEEVEVVEEEIPREELKEEEKDFSEVPDGEILEEFVFTEGPEGEIVEEKDISGVYKSVIGEEKKVEEKERDDPLYRRILQMDINEKIRLAETGGEDARAILVKDPNKLVALAVMRNPRMREDEIVSIASSRSVIPEVLTLIATTRKWVKNYSVKVALVNNPKTPVHIAMKLVPSLMEKDLKNLKKNRNVSSALINYAKKLLQQREEKKKVVKKH